MYCNITQLSVKKKHKRNKNYLFMYSSLSGSTFPPSYPWAKMCTRFCQYLKDSSAQVYDPICRSGPGLGKGISPGRGSNHNTQIADRDHFSG